MGLVIYNLFDELCSDSFIGLPSKLKLGYFPTSTSGFVANQLFHSSF